MSWFVMLSDLSEEDIDMLNKKYSRIGITDDEDCFGKGPELGLLGFYWSNDLIEYGHSKIDRPTRFRKFICAV